ncbi:MAG TPA: efflux RND transporter periplasmic adaptor subunit [Steroidobacteraceae bacterium]|nr:efflux RND transporter periplasmic adaptor subunit [Steroidobacteraceae bacterium]
MRIDWSRVLHRLGSGRQRAAAACAVLVLAALVVVVHFSANADDGEKPKAGAPKTNADVVELADAQLGMISIGAVSERSFPIQTEAVGNIDFNEDMAAQVFPPYQGRIVTLYAKIGDNVSRGQPLLTIESPDLIQAESSLIAAAGVLDLTTHALERAKQLYELQGMAEKDLQQAISDQQTAEGALKAARDAVAVFGKSQPQVDHMVKTRTIDPYLVVPSPIGGRVTARTAAPGDFVQPGNAPAPYSVADISRIWMNASVAESDMPRVRKGQHVHVAVMAFPGRIFDGEISTIGATVDPQLHRGLVRAEIDDPKHELLPGMFASFVIVTGAPVNGVAVPMEGVVREGDGSVTVWLATDGHHFTKRTVKVGLQDAGYDQILEGVGPGARIVTKGAVFLDILANGES